MGILGIFLIMGNAGFISSTVEAETITHATVLNGT